MKIWKTDQRQMFLIFSGLLCGLLFPLFARGDEAKRKSREIIERDCESCHKDITVEWRASFHRRAYSDPAYAAALAREPRPFCRGCHAPEADARKPATGWAADSGVACVTCHLRGESITSGPAAATNRDAPHPVVRQLDFATRVCQPCHEFDFPDGRRRTRPEPMQSTMSEHATLGNGASCSDCHMSRRGGRRTHGFPGGHDAALLRGSLTVQAQREPGGIAVTLSPVGAGHFIPTGDLFRRLLVEAEVDPAEKNAPPIRVARALQRHFGTEQQQPGAWVRVTERDDRLRAATTLHLALPRSSAGRPIRFRVRYQRVAHPRGGLFDAEIDGEVVIAEGSLPPS